MIRASLQIAVGLVRPGSHRKGAAVGRGERAGRMSGNHDRRDGFLGLSRYDKWAQFPSINVLKIINRSSDIDPKEAGKSRFFAAFATRQSRANVFKTSDACLFGPFSCYRKSPRPPFPPPSRTKGALSAAVRRNQVKMPNEPNWPPRPSGNWALGVGWWGPIAGQAAGQGRRGGRWDLGAGWWGPKTDRMVGIGIWERRSLS